MKKVISIIISLSLLLGLVGMIPKLSVKAGGVDAAKDYANAPLVLLNRTYTFDRNGYVDADIHTPEVTGDVDSTEYYVKLNITQDKLYEYTFKGTSASESIIFLCNEQGEKIVEALNYSNGSNADMIRLAAGTYYIGITTCHADSTGSFNIREREVAYEDLAYDLNEEIHASKNVPIEAAKDVRVAPRIAFGETYTFDRAGRTQADIRTADVVGDYDSNSYYVKLLVINPGEYEYTLKGTSEKSTVMYIYNNENEEMVYSGLCHNSSKTGTVKLDVGTYYVSICTRYQKSTGSINIREKGTEYEDVAYDLNEKAYGNEAGEYCEAALDVRVAPRIEDGKTYTFDRSGYVNANVRTSYIYSDYDESIYYTKMLITTAGYYEYKFASTSETESSIYLYGPTNKKLAAGEYLSNQEVSGYVKLDVGTYYIGISTEMLESTGSFQVKRILKPSKVTLNSVTATKKGFTANWKKVSSATNYQIQYSLNEDMTQSSSKYAAAPKVSYTVSGLEAQKNYYVRVRAYKKLSDGTKVYGSWSTVKKVKPKK